MLENMQKGFFRFISIALMIIFIPIIIGSFTKLNSLLSLLNLMDFILLSIGVASIGIVIFMRKKNIKSFYIVSFILIIGFIIRFAYICSIDSVPVSDYNTMMDAAARLLNGDNVFFIGTGYMSRFPHLIPPTLYFSTVMALTDNYLWIIKVMNVVFSTISVFIMYLIGKELFNNKKAEWLAIAMAIFPPVIVYTATYAPENIAMPFYILSSYLLIKAMKKNSKVYIVLISGIVLSIANLFRGVGAITLVAFVMFIWICNNNSVKEKFLSTLSVLLGFILPMVIVSSILLGYNITDSHLWVSAEPSITNVLKGTNIESGGRWNQEDAAIVEELNFDKNKISEVSKERIKERLTTTPPNILIRFYYNKLVDQWKSGDFSSVYWAEHSVVEDGNQLKLSNGGSLYIQIFYFVLLILSYIGLFNSKNNINNKIINLFYITLGGYGMFYLISESQERYAFIASWLFIIFAVNGIDFIYNKFNKGLRVN